MSIKKVVMYVEVNDDAVLKDDNYKESFDWYIGDGKSEEDATLDTAEDALNMTMDNIFYGEKFVSDYEFEIDDVSEDDEEDFMYRQLVERIERNKISDEEN